MYAMWFKKLCSAILIVAYISINDVLGMSDEMKELAQMLHNQCQDEHGTPEEQIVDCRDGKFADDTRLKCYIKCLYDQMGIIEDDGTIDEEGLISVLPEEYHEEASPVIRKCGTKYGADPCETAWLTNQCYYAEAPGKYFLP